MPAAETSTADRRRGPHPNAVVEMIQRLRSRRASRALSRTLLGGVALQGTLVVTGVILARALGPETRGQLALLVLVGALTLQLVGLGLPFALAYGVARVPGRAVDVIRGLRSAIVIRLTVGPVLAGAVLALLSVGKPAAVWLGAAVVTVAVIPAVLQQCGLGVLQGLQRFTAFNVLRVAPNAAFAAGAGALFAIGQTGLVQLTLMWGISAAVFAPVTVRRASRAAENLHGENSPDPPATSWLLRFGRRSMLGAAPLVETYRIDQAVVALFLAPVSLGLYVVALAFTNLPRFIAQAVGMVANPLVAGSATHAQARRRMWRFSWVAISLYLPVIVALWITVPELTDFFFGGAFASAAPLTRLLLIATAIYCARVVLTDAARGAGYPAAGTIAEVVAFVSAIPFFAFFVPTSGTNGVAYAMIASSAIAITVLVGVLVRPKARRLPPSGWFDVREANDPHALPGQGN